MIALSNQQALATLKDHRQFGEFINSLEFINYPGLDLNKVFYFISTAVLVDDMPLSSTFKLMEDIKIWLSRHSHGGLRNGAGAPKKTKNVKKITLSAESIDIEKAKNRAQKQGTSLQQMFREWLKDI